MTEFEVKAKLQEQRKQIKTTKELFDFIEEVKTDYSYGYGTTPRAIAQATLAVFNHLLSECGCTGFQAGCCIWDVIADEMGKNDSCGLRLVDYDDMLFPQYEYRFIEKNIPLSTWESLVKKAKTKLENTDLVADNVLKHWQSIVDGKVPFGYAIKE